MIRPFSKRFGVKELLLHQNRLLHLKPTSTIPPVPQSQETYAKELDQASLGER